MKNTTKLISALTIVAGLGVAMLPLGSYAATTSNTKLQVTIGETLSIATSDDNNTVDSAISGKSEGQLKETLTINSNKGNGYTVTVKAATTDPNMTIQGGGNEKIEALSAEGALEAGKWGLRVGGSGNYLAVKGSDQEGTTVIDKTGVAVNDASEINYGVFPAANQKAGTYSVDLVYTVTAK